MKVHRVVWLVISNALSSLTRFDSGVFEMLRPKFSHFLTRVFGVGVVSRPRVGLVVIYVPSKFYENRPIRTGDVTIQI
jgi:hypothetical protein